MYPFFGDFKNSDEERKYGLFLLVLASIALGILAVYTFYPYPPREGDLMACWYPYVQDWLSKGLGEALKHTDGQGKFPTQAILIIASLKITQLPLLDALQYVRLFTGLLSCIGLYLIFRKLQFNLFWSAALSALINLHPVYYGTLRMNSQDAAKPGFFLLAIYFFLELVETKSSFRSKSNIINLTGFIISASMLTMVRSVDLIPLLAFAFFWSLHRYPSDVKSLGDINKHFKSFFQNSKYAFKLILIPIILLISLLLYGKSIVGHWGFSDGEGPQPWVTFWYLKTLNINLHNDTPVYQLIADAIFWFINNVINKMSYFINDYVLMDGPIKIIGVYRFVKNLEVPGDSLFIQFINGSLGITILGVVLYKIRHDFLCKKIWTIFLYTGLSGWFFWTFLLNHYEPRYWSVVFICWSIGIFGPPLHNLITNNQHLKLKYAAGAIILTYAITFNFIKMTTQEIPHSYRRLAVAWRWQHLAEDVCKKNEEQIWTIPFQYWRWSTFKYFVEQKCSKIEVICSTGNDYYCKQPENPSHKKIINFDQESIDPERIF